jgi:adenosylcobinamide-phosphate synthase
MTGSALLSSSVAVAWLLDAVFGEPASRWHPVAWLGRVLGPVGHVARACAPAAAFTLGALAWLVLAALLVAVALWLEHAARELPAWVGVPLLAMLLKPTFAWRMLRDETAAVQTALSEGACELARERLSRLVSRDVSGFDEALLRESALESLAENLNDSVIAPLFWLALAGLPGAVLYRFANTADAMWGYRGAWEWAGKWAARADDVLSWVPARLTALLLAPHVLFTQPSRLAREAAGTPSPNGGWPMAALALALGTRLRKPGVYELNADAPSPDAQRAQQAGRRAARAAWTMAALTCTALLLIERP